MRIKVERYDGLLAAQVGIGTRDSHGKETSVTVLEALKVLVSQVVPSESFIENVVKEPAKEEGI